VFKNILSKILWKKEQINNSKFLYFEEELKKDFKQFDSWVKKIWDKKRDDFLDSDIILIKQNMFIISLNSLIENYFEKVIEYIFNDYLENNTNNSNHFYLAKSYFLESERKKILSVIKNNHNATYKKWFLVMLKKILNNNNDEFLIFVKKLKSSIEEKMNKENIDFGDFNSILWNIKKDRDSLWHNFNKFFSNNTKDYKDVYYGKINILKESIKIIYLSLDKNINKK